MNKNKMLSASIRRTCVNGRMDQLLEPFLKGTSSWSHREIIDCLFVKLCEHVHVNTRLLNDLGACGTTAVPYSSTGMFPNGDTINQWVQQVRTLCGVKYGVIEILRFDPRLCHVGL